MINNTAEDTILEAALDVMGERSISNTRMHLIAEKAGMKQPNLHYYFKTKRDLLLKLMDKVQGHFNELMDAQVNDQPSLEGKLAGFFEQKKYLILEDPRYDRVQFDLWGLGQSDAEVNEQFANSYTEWRRRISEAIEEAMPALPKYKRNLTSAMMVSMMMGASLQYLSNPKAFNINKYFNYCLETVLLSLEHQAGQMAGKAEQTEKAGE